jgi:hypothetical protein
MLKGWKNACDFRDSNISNNTSGAILKLVYEVGTGRWIMASVMNVKESKEFCDDVYAQLTDMKARIIKLKDRSIAGGPVTDVDGGKFTRQLSELAEDIDWRLQILSHSCPYGWKGSSDYEGDAQVDEMGRASDSDRFSGGYVGG